MPIIKPFLNLNVFMFITADIRKDLSQRLILIVILY